jgi:dephospho-CoA kinase
MEQPKLTKIAICGKMCSGKTTLADYIISKDERFKKDSVAAKLKEIATDLFGMKNKDRNLLINVGKKMREIDVDVWLNYVCEKHKTNFVIIDDIRYKNEYKKFKEEGFLIIRIIISKDLQMERLQNTYADSWVDHLRNISDPSETNLDDMQYGDFDLVIDTDKENVFNKVDEFLNLNK